MPSLAGLYNAQVKLRLALVSIALAAMAISLLLAFASASLPHRVLHASATVAEIPSVAPPPVPRNFSSTGASSVTPERHQPAAPLWNLLTPWALAIDAIAVLGLLGVVVVWRR